MPRPATQPAPETCELLLDAAGRIFAQHGFHATTIRRITHEAGVNIAAVNYHFRDKQELYVCALKRAHQAAARTAAADVAGPPEKRLRAFIHGFLGYLLDPERPAWQGRLIAREVAEPTKALDRLVAESMLPVKRRLDGILRELLGPRATDERLRLAICSVIGQCLFYVHCRETIPRLFPGQQRGLRDIDTLADHIFRFSLAGLAAVRRESTPKSSRPLSTKSKTLLAA